MESEFKITLPKLGESIVSATIVQWFKNEGQYVAVDEPLLEVSTDKVNSEIPSPVAGVIKKIQAMPDEELQVGDVLAVITLQEENLVAPAPVKIVTEQSVSSSEEHNDFISPAVLRVAAEKGIGFDELKKITGTGAGHRITKHDVEAYAQKKVVATTCPSLSTKALSSDVEKVKMTAMRKAIAENMVKSFYEAPHATLINEVDVTEVLDLIHRRKEEIISNHGVKLTVTSFIVHAVVKALQEYPLINASLDKDTILLKRFINVGIAVSIDQGLIVPVVKNCQKLSLIEMARQIQDLSQKARSGQLTPNDITDGTISVTNFGMSGVSIGVPIIRYPEVAIIGIGAIKKGVKVLENDVMAIRSMLHVSLTFDHRVLDGMYGCGFLNAVQKHIEQDLLLD